MPIYTKVSGSWRTVETPSVKVSGSWRDLDEAHVRVSGSWRKVYGLENMVIGTFVESEGGYFGGIIDSTQTEGSSGLRYALIVAPKTSTSHDSVRWFSGDGPPKDFGAGNVWDGLTNTNVMVNHNDLDFPAAKFCADCNVNGFNDWYLPARDEQEMLYRYFKPTTYAMYRVDVRNLNSDPQRTDDYVAGDPPKTSVTVFQAGNAQAYLTAGYYWTSTHTVYSSASGLDFETGQIITNLAGDYRRKVRPVRRVII